MPGSGRPPWRVALLAEGVDRNRNRYCVMGGYGVALLAEGVDRNSIQGVSDDFRKPSPSSRRAWIEILKKLMTELTALRRPPRGGRG